MIRSLNIHKKLLLIYSMTTLLVFLIAGSYWVYSNDQAHQTQFHQRIKSQGVLVASNIGAAILFEDSEAVTEILSALKSDPAIVSAEIFSPSNQLSYSIEFKDPPETSEHGFLFGVIEHQNWGKLTVPILESGESISKIVILFNRGERRQAMVDSATVTLLTTLLAIVLGTALASRLQRHLTQPILQLSEVAREVTQTKNYSLRTEIHRLDEIGKLGKDFNSMLGIIEQRDKNLEEIVEQRTEQILSKNKELSIQIEEREKSDVVRREMQARFEQAFINAPIGMALINKDGKLVRYNKVATTLFSQAQLESENIGDMIHHDYRDEVATQFINMTSGKISSFDSDVRAINFAGNEISVILSVSAINNDSGEFQYGVLQAQDVTESRRLSKDLEYQAQHDSLTGLANRRVLNQVLADVKKDERDKNKQHTLCIIDLDQFKTVNDTCGHIAGDELLCQVADVICSKVRKNDLVVRLGGDEFAILLHHCDKEKAQILTESIRKAIEGIHFQWQDGTFRISASIGAMTSYLADMDTSLVLQQVDSACFVAKESGRNRVHMIDPKDSEINARQSEMNWVHRLHQAMENNLFVIYAQPMFALNGSDQNEYVEILLRLRNEKDDSIISPGAFLPAAERYGLSVNIDQWVVTYLISNMPRYRQAFGDKRSYWINLSGASISDPKFLSFLEEAITQANLPPKMLNFEITETSVIRNLNVAKETILRLKTLGCLFSLDDFGSGMSSFGYLKHLPVDYIKIDGMFVRDMLEDKIDMVIVKSIVEIASVMGITTIAEYVETADALHKVKELGASYAQGYCLGLPEPLISEKLEKEIQRATLQ
jgi:diguanylate cyclase (GGDEF)-like protein/PAS domain S-box-containing protein